MPSNLVLLYLESVEANYLDEERFPQLMPFLSSLRKQSTFFTNFQKGAGNFTAGGFLYLNAATPSIF